MQKLIEGIHDFQTGNFLPLKALFERLATGQHPETLFITCSDSRVDPSLLTNAPPGDLFILRNAGNIVPPNGAGLGGEEATIEFAVTALNVQDVVICGHSHCGAMRGLLEPELLASLPVVSSWLSHAEKTRTIIRDSYGHLEGESLLMAAIAENVLVQLENLRTLPSVQTRLLRGDLRLHGWVYVFETGDVFAYDAETGQFAKLTERRFPARGRSRVRSADRTI